MGFRDRLKHAWGGFFSEESTSETSTPYSFGGVATSIRPDRPRFRNNSERTIISSIYTRLSIDVAAVRIEHCRLNEEKQYEETIDSFLNRCLNVEANLDQGARHFRQDMALTLFNEGVIAILPVDLTANPMSTSSWDIKTMRVGIVKDWRPEEVQVEAYNQKLGKRQVIWVPKRIVAIVENPFYSVMNEANSTLKRLTHKLSLLDNVDEISSQGKLDLIIQLPYAVKGETRIANAQSRAKELQDQLQNSTYGVAYTDGTESITQLNRSVENNLLGQVQYLQDQLYSEIGLTRKVMDGTADDVEMLNYSNRFIEPVMDAFVEAMIRTFLTQTARTQGQTMMYFPSPLKLLSISKFADVADVLSRNQIATPNELRPSIGLRPSKAPQANALVNSNMPIDQQITEDNAQVEDDPEAVAAEAKLDADMEALGV